MNTSLQDTPLFSIHQFNPCPNQTIPGYFAISTAPINVDETLTPGKYTLQIDTILEPSQPDAKTFQSDDAETAPEEMIRQIAVHLRGSKDPEIIIAIHGYNNNFMAAQKWYEDIYKYINDPINSINTPAKTVFLGYRWPAEYFLDNVPQNIKRAWNALPILPAVIFISGLVVSIISVFAILLFLNGFVFSLVPFGVLFSLILALILLRLVVYFRDYYRAVNFGVSDLVELIRQLDLSAFNSKLQQQATQQEVRVNADEDDQIRKKAGIEELDKSRIKLTFIGHSLGCLVIADAIRILSDVFDPHSIGTLSSSNPQKIPFKKIGHAFNLERLVFVAPDIPVETIMPRRANSLRSALRRFEEAYVFSNEGDLALRFASTAANYFSFPAMTRFSGYRLGNLTVKHFNDTSDSLGKAPEYGIVNLDNILLPSSAPYEYLEIRSSDIEHKSLEELKHVSKTTGVEPVANLFTYFDCTDYKDIESGQGVVSEAKRKNALTLWDYTYLTFKYVQRVTDKTKGIDTHSGYFQGEFSQKAIYQISFMGFKGFFKSFQDREDLKLRDFNTLSTTTKQEILAQLSQICCEKSIQVILAPERYQKDILNNPNCRCSEY